MPGTTPPARGMQGFWATIQALTTRIANLEVWQRQQQSITIARGTGTVAFTTGSSVTVQVTIPHGLGSVPSFAIGQIIVGGSPYWVLQSAAPDATNLYFEGYTTGTPGTNFSESFLWLAIK